MESTTLVIEYKWDESMATGVQTVDDQHRELIRQMNLLMQALARGEAEEQVSASLDFLGNYATRHFAHEEKCMDEYRCPVAAANKEAHAAFLNKFAAMRKQLAAGQAYKNVAAIQIIRELTDWVTNHIRRIDTGLRPCVPAANPPK